MQTLRPVVVAWLGSGTVFGMDISCQECAEGGASKEADISVAVCKLWARGGHCNPIKCRFRHQLLSDVEERRAARAAKQRAEMLARNVDHEDPFERDAVVGKGARHLEFVRWLVETFDSSLLASGVLDVAGGRGRVSFELHCKKGIPCTLLEPRPLALTSSQRRFLRKQPCDQVHRGAFNHKRMVLDDTFENTVEGRALLQTSTLVTKLQLPIGFL
ncbi:MAG: hypothetical protein SGPRY_007171 [Prymnesium sp.]